MIDVNESNYSIFKSSNILTAANLLIHNKGYIVRYKKVMSVRDKIAKNIGKDMRSSGTVLPANFSYLNVKGNLNVFTNFVVDQLMQYRVYYGLPITPKIFKRLLDMTGDALKQAVVEIAVKNFRSLRVYKYISRDGERLKVLDPIDLILPQLDTLFKIENRKAVKRSNPPQGTINPPPNKKRKLTIEQLAEKGRKHTSKLIKDLKVDWESKLKQQLNQNTSMLLDQIEASDNSNNRAASQTVEEVKSSDRRGVEYFSKEYGVAKTCHGYELISRAAIGAKNESHRSTVYEKLLNSRKKLKQKVSVIQGTWVCNPVMCVDL